MISKGRQILVILGSGLYDLFLKELSDPISVKTSFGATFVNEIKRRNNRAARIYVMMRHGPNHSVPPHLINYRANIAAAKELGVNYIIATASVGSLNRKIAVGSYVVVDQFIDFTKTRPASVYYDKPEDFAHTDMTTPYSRQVRSALISALKKNKVPSFHTRGTYVCTEGPRFESPAEIKMFGILGADVVGMTGVPEVVIANELNSIWKHFSRNQHGCWITERDQPRRS